MVSPRPRAQWRASGCVCSPSLSHHAAGKGRRAKTVSNAFGFIAYLKEYQYICIRAESHVPNIGCMALAFCDYE